MDITDSICTCFLDSNMSNLCSISKNTWTMTFRALILFTLLACKSEALQYGDQCDNTNQSSCSSPNLTCSNNATCICATSYVKVDNGNNGVSCLKQSVYGEQCDTGDYNSCIDPDTSCIQDVNNNFRCICTVHFFRQDGACKSVQDLGVTKVSATSCTTNVTLAWTSDNQGLNVTYSIQAIPLVGQLKGIVSGTGAVWADLIPGSRYNFNITSTLAPDTFYAEKIYVVVQRDVWTEPAKPGPIVSVMFISGSPGQDFQYRISFTNSTGNVARYSAVINKEQSNRTGSNFFTFYTLYPGQKCNYSITAYNEIDNPSEPSVGVFQLNTTDPGLVHDLIVQQDDKDAVKFNLTFMCPDPRSLEGNIVGYRILKILLNSEGMKEANNSYPFVVSKTSCLNSFSAEKVGGVLVERLYNFSVRMWNNNFVGDYSQQVTYFVAPRAPNLSLKYGTSRLLQKVENSNLGITEFAVQVCSQCLLDSSQGTVTDAALVVCVKGNGNTCTETITQLNSINSWGDAKMNNFRDFYRATPSDWLMNLKAQPSGLTFTFGHNTSCVNVPASANCNGPLPKDSLITIIVVQCNVAGCGQVQYNNFINTYAQNTEDTQMTLALGLGVGLGCCVLIAIIVFGVVCWKRQKPSPYDMPNINHIDKHLYIVPSDKKPNPVPHRPMKNKLTNPYIDPIPEIFHQEKTSTFKDDTNPYNDLEEDIYDYISDDTISDVDKSNIEN